MKAAARAGCVGLILGVESLNTRTHKLIKKYQNMREGLFKALEYVNNLGVGVAALIMVGLDTDTPRSIKETINVLKNSGFGLIQVGVLRAYPGTSIYEDLVKEKRIREKWWLDPSNYKDAFNELVPDYLKVYFNPKHFTPGELQLKAMELVIKTNSPFHLPRLLNSFRILRKGNKLFKSIMLVSTFISNTRLWFTLRKIKKLRKKSLNR
jgi:radical SAM superfamily enzyme YgiQ (UPF0313 family)